MDGPELSLHRLRAFLAVVRAAGFSRAARSLGQSQSSLSQAVKSLEDELGQPLLVRAGRAVHVTPAGSVLAEHAERALRELSRAVEELSALSDLSRGRLSVGTSDTLASYLLPPVFAAFRAAHPGIELRLDNRPSPEVAERVAQRELDLGVVSLPLPEVSARKQRATTRTLACEALCAQQDVVICPPAHPLARRRRLSFSELAREPLLLLARGTATRALIDQRFRALGTAPNVAMEMSSVEVIKRLVELGFGLSIIPDLAVRRELVQGSLRALKLPSTWPKRHVGLVTHAHSSLSRAARAFVAVLRTELPTR
jgi:LysR family transcriptional regulator, cyn operon transcriptional activator